MDKISSLLIIYYFIGYCRVENMGGNGVSCGVTIRIVSKYFLCLNE